jgi:KUP system potassium uptake protein
VITPSISVLSALEGLNAATASLKPLVVPAAVVVLALLFASQRFGSSKIGFAFGPIMLVWFVVVAALGVSGVVRAPQVVTALNPLVGLRLLTHSGLTAVGILGGTFLCITGGEALYADMGHFGKGSIRLSWYGVVLPALLLSYAGQTALLVQKGHIQGNPFYALAPGWALYPLVGLATLATIVASQAIITGSFSMTRQAMQLGWMPGLDIRQTSDEVYGQIYVPVVNALMAAATIAVTLAFKTSQHLAGAYGVAVSTTMLMTTGLLFAAMLKVWRWPVWRACLIGTLFLVVDLAYFVANLFKIADGGWLPLSLGAILFSIMIVWRLGRDDFRRANARRLVSHGRIRTLLKKGDVPRPEGCAIFLTRLHRGMPHVILDHIAHVGALQSNALAVSILFKKQPRIQPDERTTVHEVGAGVTAVTIRFGFVEIPNVPLALKHAKALEAAIRLDRAVYFAPRDHIVAKHRRLGLTRARIAMFVFLFRNGVRAVDRFRLPSQQVVEVGREIEI